MHDSSVGDTSMKLCTDDLHMSLIDNQPLATKKFNVFKMATPKIRPKTWFFLYNWKCIDFNPHKCIEVEYTLDLENVETGKLSTVYWLYKCGIMFQVFTI